MKKGLILTELIFSIMLSIILLPLVCAQWGGYGWGGMPTPEYWLDNPWFVFVVLFLIFFATIYISLGKVFHGNIAPVVVISAALAFFISAGVQRDWQFLQRPIMFWALILMAALAILTLFRSMALGPTGSIGLIMVILGSWPFIKNSLPLETIAVIPYGLLSFLDSVSWIFSILFGIGLVLFITAFLRALITGRWYGGRGR